MNELTEAINYLFHHTTLKNTQLVTCCLTDYSLQITDRQVRTICSLTAGCGLQLARQKLPNVPQLSSMLNE